MTTIRLHRIAEGHYTFGQYDIYRRYDCTYGRGAMRPYGWIIKDGLGRLVCTQTNLSRVREHLAFLTAKEA
jgi:hypothetical protein